MAKRPKVPARFKRRVEQVIPVLQKLNHCRHEVRKCILDRASDQVVRSLCECAHNFLLGSFDKDFKKKQQRKLFKAKKKLKALTDKNTSWKEKKVQLQRGNGFLGPLISLALPLLLGLVGK
jgi:hypothetical protein